MVAKEEVKQGICYMCGVSCPMDIHVRAGKVTRIDRVDAASYGACPRWKAQIDFIYHPERLKTPLKRAGKRGSGSFVPISWDEALDTVADNLQRAKASHGPESVAFYVSYPKEPRPYFRRLTHAFGSPNYCTESSSCASAAWLAILVTYGLGYAGFGGKVIPPETRCALVWGSNVQVSSSSAWQSYIDGAKRGLKLIVVDPRRIKLASMADVFLQIRPGTDGALALGMMHVIINENLYDTDFCEKWTIGFDELKKLANAYPPERVERITWAPAAKIIEAARLFATQKPAKLIYSINSSTHHTNGVQNHRAMILLSALTGNIGVPGGNTPEGPAIRLNDVTLHERVHRMPPGVGGLRFPLWTGRYREMQANALADQIDSGQPNPIKAMFTAGMVLQFFPNTSRLTEMLKKLDFIAITEYFPTPATRLADIVLPIASWLERPILLNRRSSIELIQPAIEPVGESWHEWKIYAELAKRLGFGELFWDGDFEKCVNFQLEPTGITYQDLQRSPGGIKPAVPVNQKPSPQDKRFQTPSGKVEIVSSILAQYGYEPLPVYEEPPESPLLKTGMAKTYPLVLTSGARVPAYFHSQFRNIPRLRRQMPEPLIDIHPSDAKPRGIQSGDLVIITSPRGAIRMTAHVTPSIIKGVVSLPHHWPGDANANILVDDQTLDPISGFPPFKSQLCQVEKGSQAG